MHSVTRENTAKKAGTMNSIRRRLYLFLPLILAIFFLVLPADPSFATGKAFISEKTPLEGHVKAGDEFYAKRADGYKDGIVDATNIKKALASYHKAYALGDNSEALVIKIMRATYFYADYAEQDPSKKKKAFTDSIEVGKKAIKDKPKSVGLNYQMAGAWGSWGDANGIWASARQGVADKVKVFGEEAVKLDPSYGEGGGYRTLGRLHFKAPRIPFILSWPSKKKSKAYLEKAVQMGPTNLTNHFFLAETLVKLGEKEQALREIDFILRAEVNPMKKVEDLRDKKDATLLKEQITGK